MPSIVETGIFTVLSLNIFPLVVSIYGGERRGESLRDGIRAPIQLKAMDAVRVQDEMSTKDVIRVMDGLELGRVRGQK